ncbi:STAS-like domain-containing protein [Rhodobacter ferrooxidans]|uniref:STAS-like domain-containing protein n=1 Tax=Rhodobacter ferrooxidans TaxID=371731 RepID=UPI0009FC41BA|nr:STAS-like domain-containing protein [Rhodobacter sp. SW2]
MTTTINIAKDYTRFPGGRYPEDGKGNGTSFRKKFLVPVMKSGDHAVVILDGAAGYPSSFLDEAFAGLVRKEGFSAESVLKALRFQATDPGFSRFIEMIESYVRSATPEKETHH